MKDRTNKNRFPLGQGDFGDDSPKVPASEINTYDYDFILKQKRMNLKMKHHYNGQGGGNAFQCWPRRVAKTINKLMNEIETKLTIIWTNKLTKLKYEQIDLS
jgi:hypothetical protein